MLEQSCLLVDYLESYFLASNPIPLSFLAIHFELIVFVNLTSMKGFRLEMNQACHSTEYEHNVNSK